MKNQSPIAQLPLTKWEPVHESLERMLVQLHERQRDSFSISFALPGYDPHPYLQATLDSKGDFALECSSNVFLEPDINRWQISQLDSLGWSKPNGKNPNFNKVISAEHPESSTSRYLLSTIRMVFAMPENTWIIFEDTEQDFEIYSSSKFWHKLHTPGVVCLPGFNHFDTIEGTN